jgi:hypothetical protein
MQESSPRLLGCPRFSRSLFLCKPMWLIQVSLITSVSLFASDKAQDRIPIFVKSAGDVTGFTDPSKARQDSVKDIQEKLKNSKLVFPVESEKDALAILEVLNRDTKREMTGWGAQNRSYLTVRLTAGEYSTEFVVQGATSGVFTGYGKAAAAIVKQLEDWVKANHDRLLALKK